MKATLEFNEYDELSDAINGWRWRSLAWDFDQKLRGVIRKNMIENVEATDEQIKNAEYWRAELRGLMSEMGLNFEP